MKNNLIEGSGYYLSCTILFNLIYILNYCANVCLNRILFYVKNWNGMLSFSAFMNGMAFLIPIIAFFLGILATGFIINRDDSISEKNTLGKTITPVDVMDMTGENYFANFSLLALTGLALPTMKGIFSLIIYLLMWITMGIVYVNKSMIYMNTILSIKKYSIYRCRAQEDSREYLFVVKGFVINENQPVNIKRNSGRIIRICK